MENASVSFTVGHHDPDRPLPVTAEAVASAHASGVRTEITMVLTLLSGLLSESGPTLGKVFNERDSSSIVVPPLAPEDTPLTPDDTISQIVGITASWIDLGSPDPVIADVSRQVLQLELAYAAFCGLSHVIIPGPNIRGNDAGGSDIVQYARTILEALGQGPFMTVYIWLPMIDHSENLREEMGDLAPFARSKYLNENESESKELDVFGTWQAWDIIRSICRYSTRLCVALSVPRLLPPSPIQSRWFSEPVRILTLDGDVFVRNPKGYPVLSKAHQALVFRFVQCKQPAPWFLLCRVGPVPTSSAAPFTSSDPDSFPTLAQANSPTHLRDPTPQLSYMRNLQTKAPPRSSTDVFTSGYQDYLQAPLQPLTVNLESITYEVFEKDPIKYEWYERAVARALHDWIEEGKPTSNPDGRVVVAVVGAGRGPLVTRALQASEAVDVEIDIWALEKNPNAFVLLQRHNQTTWNHKVNLVKSDMRTWRGPVRPTGAGLTRKTYNLDSDEEESQQHREQTPAQSTYTGSAEIDSTYLMATEGHGQTLAHTATTYKIDILISELLGSFADNELSPECLDGVQHLLNPTHGISIPASYTAHMTPVAAPKLHADISLSMVNTIPNAAEVPYVVMFNAIDFLSTETVSINKTPPTQPRAGPEDSPEKKPQTKSWSAVAQTASQPQSTSTATHSISSIPPNPTPIIKQTWAFEHPNPSLSSFSTTNTSPMTTVTSTPSNTHNTRHSIHRFPIPNRGTCHGIAGYFESVLYRGVELSTNPNTMSQKSQDMISWFPIFFPLKTPLYCPDTSTLCVQMWRQTDDRKVWYEWIVDVFVDVPVPVPVPVGGGGGSSGGNSTDQRNSRARTKRVKVGGSELHSSEKEGCLM